MFGSERPYRPVTWAVLAGLLCLAGGGMQAGAESAEPAYLSLGGLTSTGRPAGFYRSILETDPSVCREILSALNLGLPETKLPTKNAGDLLLGSALSVPWRALEAPYRSRSLRFFRIDLDMNGDGVEETIYRRDEIWGPYTPQRLFWVENAPADEREITLQRDKEVQGAHVAAWEGGNRSPVNMISIRNGFSHWDGSVRERTIHPPLPKGLKLPGGSGGGDTEGGSFYDIALLKGRVFVLKASARYYEEFGKAKVFAFSSQGPRRHKFECLFEGRYEIRSLRRVRELKQQNQQR